jgi:hypothetical protein
VLKASFAYGIFRSIVIFIGKPGIMECWNGGMVEWWNGGMVEWWNGGMVEWWNGIKNLVGRHL